MTSGFVLGPGEGSAYGFHGSVAVIKASGEDTLGQLGVIESVYPAALAAQEHVHAGEDEMFYLLGGEIEVFCGEDRWTVGAGSFVFVPCDRPHGFTVSSAGPARALVITGPSRLGCGACSGGEAEPGQIGGKSLVQSAGRYSTAVPFVWLVATANHYEARPVTGSRHLAEHVSQQHRCALLTR